jgi:hypothetical protein
VQKPGQPGLNKSATLLQRWSRLDGRMRANLRVPRETFSCVGKFDQDACARQLAFSL